MTEERILDKVRKMLDRANHPGTPAGERDVCLQKADAMMMKHAIDEAMLDATRTPEQRRKPISREFQAWEGFRWYAQFQTILSQIARTAGVRCVIKTGGQAVLVGMSDDANYVEMLWTTIYFQFVARMDPTWDNNLSFEHNVYNFKEAGTKWKEIARVANENLCHVDWPDGGVLIRAYRRHCKIIGERPRNHTQRHTVYRESFAESFETTICYRLEEMRRDRKEASEQAGAGLVLYNAAEEVNDMFWDLFPERHPDAVRERNEKAIAEAKQSREDEIRAREALLAGMTEKQRAEFLAKEERKKQRDAAADDRYWERRARLNHDSAGASAGRKAGEQVDLTRTGGRVGDDKRGELS